MKNTNYKNNMKMLYGLGILRTKYKLTNKDVSTLKRLDKYNLSFITSKFTYKKNVFNNEQVYPILKIIKKINRPYSKQLEIEFKRYMALNVIKKHNVSPSVPVDMYWHLLILDTENYKKFCTIVFGRFINHTPSSKRKLRKAEIQKLYKMYCDTVQLYSDVFGKTDPRFW